MKDDTEDIRQRLVKKAVAGPPDFSRGLSTGSTLLNLAYTGRPDVGYVPGTYYYLVGDSNSGKSFCSMVAAAEACRNPLYDDYRLILDNVEDGVQMDVERFFGSQTAERLEPPRTVKGNAVHSTTVEEFYFHLDAVLDKGQCIYVLDSMDGLSSVDEGRHFGKLKKAVMQSSDEDDEEVKTPGSYGDGKAKKNSAMLRQMLPKIARTGSLLIVISQTRDNVGTFSFEKKTRSGGHSLAFYAQVQTWSSVIKKLKRKVRGKDRHVGNLCKFHVKRSRFTGREASVEIPIYFSHGLDEVGSCVDYLISEGHWKKAGAAIKAPEFDLKGTREELIGSIESENLEGQLSKVVCQVWKDIEGQMAVDRKKRYT